MARTEFHPGPSMIPKLNSEFHPGGRALISKFRPTTMLVTILTKVYCLKM